MSSSAPMVPSVGMIGGWESGSLGSVPAATSAPSLKPSSSLSASSGSEPVLVPDTNTPCACVSHVEAPRSPLSLLARSWESGDSRLKVNRRLTHPGRRRSESHT